MYLLDRNEDFESLISRLLESKLVYKTSSPYHKIYVLDKSEFEGKRGKVPNPSIFF